jgi:hypothetical protein
MIDGRFPAAVIFLNVGVIVVHLGVVGERPQSRPAGQIEKERTKKNRIRIIARMKEKYEKCDIDPDLHSISHSSSVCVCAVSANFERPASKNRNRNRNAKELRYYTHNVMNTKGEKSE